MDDVTCMACGCLCDDIRVGPDGAIANACEHGSRWIKECAARLPPAQALFHGQPASYSSAVAAAARILAKARFPLIFGLGELCVDGQRAAVALADAVGACIDVNAADEEASVFLPGIGASGCTWGEVIQRADLMIYCNCDLTNNWWRHKERVIDRIRRNRHVAVELLTVEIEDIWRLRALVQGKKVHATRQWTDLTERLRKAKYVVLVQHADARLATALQALARDVNLVTRCRVIDLGGNGNSAGRSQVVRWQTGYSHPVGLHRGYPVSFAREFAAETLLRRGEADVCLSFGMAADGLSIQAKEHLEGIQHIVIAPGRLPLTLSPQFALFASTPGINASGTAFRSDGVTLRLRAPYSSSLSAPALVIKRLMEETGGRRAE